MTLDRELLLAWRDGDLNAAEKLVTRHYDAIARFFSTKAGAEADDLVQQTFLRCGEGAGRYRGTHSVRAFLFGIARNVLYEHIRGKVRDRKSEPDFRESALLDLKPGVSTQADQREETRALVRALQQIPLESQVLLEAYYWEHLKVAELAAIFDVPIGTIKSRLHHARGELKHAITHLPPELGDRESVRLMVARWLGDMRSQRPNLQ